MKTQEVFFFFLIFVLVLLFIYFITAKGKKKNILLTNALGKKVKVEVDLADNFTTQVKGLMGRTVLGDREGMLFIFNRSAIHGFWMLNTSLELEAIHFSENGLVVDIIKMQPNTMNKYYPKESSKYVLEVYSGFSEKNKISIGKSKLVLPP
jgi:uncharacterized membrane protein (UPF0127 family)